MKQALLTLLTIILFGCRTPDAAHYFNNYFELKDNAVCIIYVFRPDGCQSCNTTFMYEIKDKLLSSNEHLLLVSRYPYCESEKETTLFFKKKFNGRFAIDSTDNFKNYHNVPSCTQRVLIEHGRITSVTEY
jgi:hypothetical protein